MSNSMIRFKGFEFEHNPETLKITTENNVRYQRIVNGKDIVSQYGRSPRVITGEGSIIGADCMYKFLRLFRVKEQSGSGVLSVPFTKPIMAYFKKLDFLAEPTPELITYRFEFVEDCPENRGIPVKKFYTTSAGEDLWDISYRFDVAVEKLLELNPQIKRPEEVMRGAEIRLC